MLREVGRHVLRRFAQQGAESCPSTGGSQRWLGAGALRFQPSEIAKLAVLVYIAAWLASRGKQITQFSLGFVPFVLLYACVRTLASAREDLKPAAWALVASGVVVAIVGLVQVAVGEVWWNPKVVDANRFLLTRQTWRQAREATTAGSGS